MYRQGVLTPDVAIVQTSLPDVNGYCSLGTSVDCTLAAFQTAGTRVAHVNAFMPRTMGDGIVHMSEFDSVFFKDRPLPEHKQVPVSDVERKIGRLIAENLVEDGATLQMGIGGLPNAVFEALKNHKDLGIHSEMFSDGVLPLVESGVINNTKKTHFPGKLVTSFCVGSKPLYDFLDCNEDVLFMELSYTNKLQVVASQHKMTAINSCIEVDLTGQVCSDSIGTEIYSGIGGQADFILGASLHPEGKSIIALPSQTHKGIPRIVPTLKPGAGVVTTRAMVRYVVTEYGIANLYGKTLPERAKELIRIAHPNDREALEREAFARFGGY